MAEKRSRIRRAIDTLLGREPKRGSMRMYGAARGSRLTGGFGSGGDTSADAELSSSLTRLRSASRQMVRDSSYAKRARTIVVNNVIGSGVGMQAQTMTTRGDLNKRVNADIEAAWCSWAVADSCHTGGALHFHDLERAAMGQVFEAGEVFIRLHTARFGRSKIPLALELIESERVPIEAQPIGTLEGVDVRMGIEHDEFGRAVAYWIRKRHPGDVRFAGVETDRYERVPADEVMHLRLVDRWPQTRGEPWLHTAVKKLNDMNEYSASEVQAARMSSYLFGTIESKDEAGNLATDEEDDGTQVMDIQPGLVQQLNPGEEFKLHNPNRPNVALDPFLRYMLREMAAGVGVSYESLSRDYSQSNYSSSRLALLDDRDLWRMLQQWWIRSFRAPLHSMWLMRAVLARSIPSIAPSTYAPNQEAYEAVLWKPRGWSWIDPTKEVAAYKEGVKAGFISTSDVIALTADGRDIEDVVTAMERDKQLFAEAGIEVDTDVAAERAAKAAPTAVAPKADPGDDDGEGDTADASPARVFSIGRTMQ